MAAWRCRRARHQTPDHYEEELVIRRQRRRGPPLGGREHFDPDLQVERHRPARLAHRRLAEDRLGSNQEPQIARTAAVELAPPTHHRRRVVTATTAYLAAPSSRQSVASVVPPRR